MTGWKLAARSLLVLLTAAGGVCAADTAAAPKHRLSPLDRHSEPVEECGASKPLILRQAQDGRGCCAQSNNRHSSAASIPADSLGSIQDILARVSDLLWEKSDQYFHDGYHQWCIAVMRLLGEIDPTDVEAFAVGSWLIDSSGRQGEALAFLEHGLSLNRNRYNLYAELGHFHYFQTKDYAKAVDYLEAAVKFSDCAATTWHLLAHAYEHKGDLARAVEVWEHAATLEPGNPVVEQNLNRVKERLRLAS